MTRVGTVISPILGRGHRGRPGPHGSSRLGRGGHQHRLDKVDSFDRTAVPGQVTVPVTGPDGALVAVSTFRSTARYDIAGGQLGKAVLRFEARREAGRW
jgi:hypothetical protein